VRIDPNQGLTSAQGGAPDRISSATSSATSRSTQQNSTNQLDQANLSSDAVQYSKLTTAIGSLPDIRQGRVAALQQAIQSGNFSVSNQQIAVALQRDSGAGAAVAGKS